jgi:hypothetical protein
MKVIENRLRKLERANPDDDFVRLPDDLSLWTHEHIDGLVRWIEDVGDAGPFPGRIGCISLHPSPLDDLSPSTLKALVEFLVESLETYE